MVHENDSELCERDNWVCDLDGRQQGWEEETKDGVKMPRGEEPVPPPQCQGGAGRRLRLIVLLGCPYHADMLADLERGAQPQLHGHEEVVVANEAQSSAIDLVLDKSVDVGLIAEVGEELPHVLRRPLDQRSAAGVHVGWGGGANHAHTHTRQSATPTHQ